MVTGFEDTAIHLQDTHTNGQMALSLASLEKWLDEHATENIGLLKSAEFQKSVTDIKVNAMLDQAIEHGNQNDFKTVELDTEEGYSFLDGVRNNLGKDRKFEKRAEQKEAFRESELSEQIAEEKAIYEQEKLGNFKIRDTSLVVGGLKSKFLFNVEAITLLKVIEKENRSATPQEQETLSKYVGFGGIPQAFDEQNEKWHKEYTTLKESLSPDEYYKARAFTLNAFYTNPMVIRAMYETLEKMGFQKGKLLEPSITVGNFFGLFPDTMKESALYSVKLDDISGRIATHLYPNTNIQIPGFEKNNFEDNFFDVAIGNVTFGNYIINDSVYNPMKLPIHDYFFAKTLDKVRPDGVIAFITSKGTLDKRDTSFRRYLSKRADLLEEI